MLNNEIVGIVAISSVSKDVEKLDPSHIAGESVKCNSYLGNNLAVPQSKT